MPGQVLATSFVEPRGTIKSIIAGTVAREVAGAVTGVAAAPSVPSSGESSTPLAAGQLGYLAAFDDQIVMYRAKRGAFKPKPTDEVYATAPRESVAGAELDRKKISGVLTVRFTDGNEWAFDIPKIYLNTADAVVRALTPA